MLRTTAIPPAGFELLKLTLGSSLKEQLAPLRGLLAAGRGPAVLTGLGGWSTVGYAISRDGARYLRQRQTPLLTTSDGIFKLAQLKTLGREASSGATPFRTFHLAPPLAWQSQMGARRSEIGVHSYAVNGSWLLRSGSR